MAVNGSGPSLWITMPAPASGRSGNQRALPIGNWRVTSNSLTNIMSTSYVLLPYNDPASEPGQSSDCPPKLQSAAMQQTADRHGRGIFGARSRSNAYAALAAGRSRLYGSRPQPDREERPGRRRFYQQHGCDGVVGVGGGSPIDAAKAIRLKVTHPLDLAEYDDNIGGDAKITANIPPYIAIPTTAGYRQRGRAIHRDHDREDQSKTVIFSPHLIPSVSIVDPELTLDLPPHITAGTGMDAFTHNVEAYLSKGFQPICDAIALGGAKLASENLPRVMQQPHDVEARGNMLMASMMGAIAFQKGLGATHSLAHPLSSEFGMHHGTANAVLLPAVLEWNRESVAARFDDLQKDLGSEPVERVRELNRICGIAPRLTRLWDPGRGAGDARRESDRGRMSPAQSAAVYARGPAAAVPGGLVAPNLIARIGCFGARMAFMLNPCLRFRR